MKKFLCTFSALALINIGFAQNWQIAQKHTFPVAKTDKNLENGKLYTLDIATLKNKLIFTPSAQSRVEGMVVTLPTSEGKLEQFSVWESSILSPKLQEKYPTIKTYVGRGISDPTAYVRFSVTPLGLSSSVFREGNRSDFIETYDQAAGLYAVHSTSNVKNNFVCSTTELISKHQSSDNTTLKANNQVFKTYRLALSVTAEYTQYFGGTKEKALAAMTNTMTRVNGVFEKDMAINFQLVDDTDQLIFTDAATDPYSNSDIGMNDDPIYGNSHEMQVWNVELQKYLRDSFGESKYDIGHLFGHEGGGGNAGCIGCICESAFPDGKGSGITSPANGKPSGDKFDIDYVAHEIGHQIGANHTFSFRNEGRGVNVEPGSGSTIMGYAGITSYNVQNNSDSYFTYRSILQVQNNLANKTCGISRPIINTPPQITLENTAYSIPKGTPFKLDATISDTEDQENILVTWEQNNTGTSSTQNANSRVSATKTTGPNFRSFTPTKETHRYFPRFDRILKGELANASNWEAVATVARTYDFTVTARDNNPTGAQTQTKSVKVTSTNAGPFVITLPNKSEKLQLNTGKITVNWNVAETDQAPINTAKVKVLISWDNGSRFTELGIVDNVGTATFSLPSNAVATTTGFVMIEAVDNIYLAVNPFTAEGVLSLNETLTPSTSIQISPNPSKGRFTITHPFEAGNIDVQLIDLTGRVVFSQNSKHPGGQFRKDYTTQVAKGVYVLQIQSNNTTHTSKLIIH